MQAFITKQEQYKKDYICNDIDELLAIDIKNTLPGAICYLAPNEEYYVLDNNRKWINKKTHKEAKNTLTIKEFSESWIEESYWLDFFWNSDYNNKIYGMDIKWTDDEMIVTNMDLNSLFIEYDPAFLENLINAHRYLSLDIYDSEDIEWITITFDWDGKAHFYSREIFGDNKYKRNNYYLYNFINKKQKDIDRYNNGYLQFREYEQFLFATREDNNITYWNNIYFIGDESFDHGEDTSFILIKNQEELILGVFEGWVYSFTPTSSLNFLNDNINIDYYDAEDYLEYLADNGLQNCLRIKFIDFDEDGYEYPLFDLIITFNYNGEIDKYYYKTDFEHFELTKEEFCDILNEYINMFDYEDELYAYYGKPSDWLLEETDENLNFINDDEEVS